MSTLGYASWLAFLVFWLVFGRLVVAYYMTTQVFGGYPTGTAVQLTSAVLNPGALLDLELGTVVVDEIGRVALDPELETIFQVKADLDGLWRVGEEEWDAFDAERLCIYHERSQKLPLVVVSVPPQASYAFAVEVADRVILRGEPHGCRPRIAFASSLQPGPQRVRREF